MTAARGVGARDSADREAASDRAGPDAPARPLVVKLGGTTIAEEQGVLGEIAGLARARPLVVVHGGGRRLTDWLVRLGVGSRFHEGLRVTDDAALEVALAVLGGVVNGELVAALRSMDADAVGLCGIDGGTLRGPRRESLGRVVAEPRADGRLIRALHRDGRLPVVAPLAFDQEGVICNVNADDAAAAIAAGLEGDLVLLTDTDGVRGAGGQRIATLTADEAERLIADGTISGGMIPKVRCALRALGAGGEGRTVICDGRLDRALSAALSGAGGTTLVRAA